MHIIINDFKRWMVLHSSCVFSVAAFWKQNAKLADKQETNSRKRFV